MLIDTVASRYHCLPSNILANGDTFDVWVANNAIDLQHRHRERAEALEKGEAVPVKPPSQEQMLAMMARAKEWDNGNKTN